MIILQWSRHSRVTLPGYPRILKFPWQQDKFTLDRLPTHYSRIEVLFIVQPVV